MDFCDFLLFKGQEDCLQEGLCSRRPRLQHDGKDGEEDDLDGGTAGVPVGAADTKLEKRKFVPFFTEIRREIRT